MCHNSPAISAAHLSFQRKVHADHQHFMAVALYDKLRFFKFFTTYDCFMGSFCNILLPFRNRSDNTFAGNQCFGFAQNHCPGVHISREDFPNASTIPKNHWGDGIGRFLAVRLIFFVIKATDEQVVALASIPKEERTAILEELKKKKSDRDDTVLERLKPSKPPPKPKPAPQKKKPTATENNTASQAEQPETSVQAPITESPPEEEIEPTSNAPPSFLQSIQGHKRHLFEEDKARLQASVDARYKDKATATGSIMLCELQGATEEFIFRWNVIFQEHPDVLTDKTCRKTIFELFDRMTNYLKTIKEEKL